jgi:endo-1,4-beta-xylanase
VPGYVASGQEQVRLSDLGEHIISHVQVPSLTSCLPDRNDTPLPAVLIIPGGGHRELWMDHEGYNVASYLSSRGMATFILKYRLARESGSSYSVEGTELGDAQRAIRLIRSRAASWHVDPKRLGVIGFSAGGELAILAASRFDAGNPKAADPIDRQSSRPDFQALIYPAIPEHIELTTATPPAFLAAGSEDQPVMSQGLAAHYIALRKAGVPAELRLYDGLGHGFGLRRQAKGEELDWPREFVAWLARRGLLTPIGPDASPAAALGRCNTP